MRIADNLSNIKSDLPDGVVLVTVSKGRTVGGIMEAYNAGQRVFGENRVQELVPKYHTLPKDIQWHIIGHLQSNKVKYIAPFITMIHSVDSAELLKIIEKEAGKHNRTIDCLLQVKIAKEETKYGMTPAQADEILCDKELNALKFIKIKGLMAMATQTDDAQQIRSEFSLLKKTFDRMKNNYPKIDFDILSAGMSDDYAIAIEEGATMVRIGSKIFTK